MNSLTPAQLNALVLMARGLPDRLSADEMGIREEGLRSHIKKAVIKLNARNRPHAVAKAFKAGLITPAMIATSEGPA